MSTLCSCCQRGMKHIFEQKSGKCWECQGRPPVNLPRVSPPAGARADSCPHQVPDTK